MRLKKFSLPIGILVVVICAIGFLSLRSDVVDEPIVIIKTTPPEPASVRVSKTPVTTPTSMPIEEPAVVPENAEVPQLSEACEYAEFSREELLKRFPQYDFHNSASRANLRDILRMEKEEVVLRVRQAELERKITEQEAQKELYFYAQSVRERLDREYPDVMAFIEKYPQPRHDDFIREYPDETERRAFAERVIEAGKIISALADRFLATPGVEELPSEVLETLNRVSLLDEVIEEVLE